MILFLAAASLSAASSSGSAIDAERAFARDAQKRGQWAAFRKWADHDAVMFVPKAVWARDFLKDRKEPKQAVKWWPRESITSCDGQVAVNDGPWRQANGTGGRFATVWLKKPEGWRWVFDAVETRPGPIAASPRPVIRRASCAGRPTGAPIMPARTTPRGTSPDDIGRGESGDRTLGWDWKVDDKGTRTLRVFQWTGRRYAQVLDQAAPAE